MTITIASATIATHTRQFDVLTGEFNNDGVVDGSDVVGTRNEWLRINGAVPTIFGDINGDGVVNSADYIDVRNEVGTTLPSLGDPSSALGASSQAGPALVPIGTSAPSQPAAPSRARPRAEIQLSARGWIRQTVTRGKMINQGLIEKT